MDTKSGLRIKVLGCGDAFGNAGRFNTSFLVSDSEEAILLDCGASTLVRLKQEKIDLSSISTIVLSHFHGDHFGGVPFFLISCLYEHPRTLPLKIVGPAGVEERVRNLIEAMYPGTTNNLDTLDIRFIEYEAEREQQFTSFRLMAFSVKHSPPSSPHGIRLAWNGQVIAFSGDTSWTNALLELARDADVFICECNFMEKRTEAHLSYEELLDKRHLFDCKQMFLTHMADEVIDARNVAIARLSDGQTIEVK